MALIKCPECGKEMSDKALACPNCGFPVSTGHLCTTSDADVKPHKKYSKKALGIAVAAVTVVLVICVLFFFFLSPKAKLRIKYNEAEKLYSAGNYSEALPLYEDLGNYKNSLDATTWCKYLLAIEDMNSGEYASSKEYLEEIDYENSEDLLKQCNYELGIQAMTNNEWETALSFFEDLDYLDSDKMLIDCQFMRDLKDSVLRRMEINAKENSDLLSIVNTELAYLQKYSNASFYNSSLKKQAKQYISGLKEQEEALGQLHQWDYQEDWNTGLLKRYEVLNLLYEEYGFLADNKDFIGEYINQYEYRKKWFEAFKALENMFWKEYRNEENYSQDKNYFYFTFTNTTQYTFTNQMDFWIYDYEGKNLLDTASIISEDIRPNDTVTVKLYVGSYDSWNIKEYGNWYPEIRVS